VPLRKSSSRGSGDIPVLVNPKFPLSGGLWDGRCARENRNSPPAILLRESYRETGKVKNRTLANLSSWPEARITALSRALKVYRSESHRCSSSGVAVLVDHPAEDARAP
jgi:hypothetical protein